MPVTLATVNARRATVKITIESETLTVTYNRSALTPEFQSQITEWGKTDLGHLPKTIELLVVEWDLLGDDGKPYPLKEKALAKLPVDILDLVAAEILRDMSPNRETPVPSGSFS